MRVLRSTNGNNSNGISDTELYKNQFRLSTLRHLQKTCGVKNPIPKDERVALLHYHPLVRQELRWTKNTPASQKYKISPQLASTIPNMNINEDRCHGLNIDKCYIVPTYDFNKAKAEVLQYETEFYDTVKEIKIKPTEFCRSYYSMKDENALLKQQILELKRNQSNHNHIQANGVAAVGLAATQHHQHHHTQQQQQQQQMFEMGWNTATATRNAINDASDAYPHGGIEHMQQQQQQQQQQEQQEVALQSPPQQPPTIHPQQQYNYGFPPQHDPITNAPLQQQDYQQQQQHQHPPTVGAPYLQTAAAAATAPGGQGGHHFDPTQPQYHPHPGGVTAENTTTTQVQHHQPQPPPPPPATTHTEI